MNHRNLTLLWQHGLIALLCVSMSVMTACSVDAILTDIDVVLQTADNLETAIGAVSPADGAALQLLTGVAIAGITEVKKVYDQYEASKTPSNLQNVVVAAQAIQTNLPQELAAIHIADQNAVTKATAWVSLVTDAVAGIISTIQGTKAMATASTHGIVMAMPTPESLQARWQSGVCSGDVACGNLVKVHNKRAPFKL